MNVRGVAVTVAAVILFSCAIKDVKAQEGVRTCQELAALQQTDPTAGSYFEKQFCAKVSTIKTAKANQPTAGLDFRRDFFLYVFALVRKSGRAQYIVDAQEARLDKQVGSDPGNAGSTSLVVKGGVPSILGLAVENGALARTFSGTTITFRGSPLGIVKALANKGFVEAYDEDADDSARFLRGLSFALSFDASRGDQPGVFTGSRQQLSSYSFRYEFYNKRDPRDRAYKKDWDSFLTTASQALANQLQASLRSLTNLGDDPPPANPAWIDPPLQQWYESLEKAVAAATPDQVEATLREGLDQMPFGDLSEQTVNETDRLNTRLQGYLGMREDILEKVAKGGIVTFEYTNNRAGDAPDLSNLRLIAETGFGGRVDLTANASLTLFNRRPNVMSAGRVRDFQLAGQIDVRLGEVRDAGIVVLSFAGRYERLLKDASSPMGDVITGTKGDIAFGQMKLTIPVKGSGVRIPISVTFANRDELNKESFVRGNFGVTFDLDSIFARFKP